MKSSLREVSIDVVIHKGICKNNQITFFASFDFIPKTWVSFSCAHLALSLIHFFFRLLSRL